ncbi:hypothetical protein BSLG_003127 [Batrachochytrium salamandrivorans]|nr:hypothetical protein BSLG_003127 [Batrachochytrium salamandrivorans]
MQTLITLTSNQADLLLPYRKLLAARRFWREFHLFDRLRSKSTNQHRSSIHLRKTVLVKRLIMRLKELQLGSLLLPDKKTPTSLSPYPVMLQLMGAYMLLCKLFRMHKRLMILSSIYNTTIINQDTLYMDSSYRAVASQTYFMATSLTFSAVSARLHFLANLLKQQCRSCYDLLWSWSREVPAAMEAWFTLKFPPNLASLDQSAFFPRQLSAIVELADYQEAQVKAPSLVDDTDSDGDSGAESNVPCTTRRNQLDNVVSHSYTPNLSGMEPTASVSDEFWTSSSPPPISIVKDTPTNALLSDRLSSQGNVGSPITDTPTIDQAQLDPSAPTSYRTSQRPKTKPGKMGKTKSGKSLNEIDDIFSMM